MLPLRFLLALAGFVLTARATTVIAPTFDELVGNSELIFRGHVTSVEDGLTGVRLDTGEIVYSTDPALGEVGVVVYPWDVSIGRVHADDSALNLIHGVIGSVSRVGNRVRVRVGPVTAEVTAASAERLDLAHGGVAVASFKATGTRLLPLAR